MDADTLAKPPTTVSSHNFGSRRPCFWFDGMMASPRATSATAAVPVESSLRDDPLLRNHERSSVVKEGDWVILKFADEKKTLFLKATSSCSSSSDVAATTPVAAASTTGRPKTANKKKTKSSCSTRALVGLQYGRVVEQTKNGFVPLGLSEKLIPDLDETTTTTRSSPTAPMNDEEDGETGEVGDDVDPQSAAAAVVAVEQQGVDRPNPRDNSSLVDSRANQQLNQADLERLKRTVSDKRQIVTSIVENSKTYNQKTSFAQEKYVRRKQKKHLSRCRIVRATARTLCQYWHQKDPKRMSNLRDDTLAQLLAYANISAGCQTLVVETCWGIVTGAVAERLSGYGRILSVYDDVQPKYREQLDKLNLSFIDASTVHWVHAGDIFGSTSTSTATEEEGEEGQQRSKCDDEVDTELQERQAMQWPCYLQPHTRGFVESELAKSKVKGDNPATTTATGASSSSFDLDAFMYKRANRFLRKLCRSTPLEARRYLDERLCDSIIMACHYDPVQTLLPLLRFLAPSCPFVVYCEFLEPLLQCFQTLQETKVAINLRLCDTWMREYQVLAGRTHPVMLMGQNGGYILTGVRLHDTTGHNELDDEVLESAKTKWRKMKRSQSGRRSAVPRPATGNKES